MNCPNCTTVLSEHPSAKYVYVCQGCHKTFLEEILADVKVSDGTVMSLDIYPDDLSEHEIVWSSSLLEL